MLCTKASSVMARFGQTAAKSSSLETSRPGYDEAMQDRESLRPQRDLVPVEQEAAAVQIQDITVESEPFRALLRGWVCIAIGHCPAMAAVSTRIDGRTSSAR
jgi:hypothetical protein